MADVSANIHIGIDASSAVGQLRALESQISAFNNSVVRSNAAAVATQKDLITTLQSQIGATGQFSTSIRTMESGVASLGTAFDKGTLSARQYFRYAASQMPGLTKAFRSLGAEQAQMAALAEDRVKRLQTRYVSLGKDIHGMQQVMAIQPKNLASGYATDLAVAQEKQQLLNRALQLGSTGLVNWGKNTQWAGRQLMVGFTVPMTIAAGAAAKFFMELDKSSVAFKRVYGDMNTTTQETQKNLDAIKALGGEYTKYGLAVNEVIDIGARAAATGAQNEDLLAATEQTLRLATLGQTDYQTALDATISLQTAFGISSKQLGTTIDFLNAVENQTVLTLDDMARAVPRVAPVIKGLGGDVQDLAVFMTALREGGVSAEQGANALKSGLASLINPTDRAVESLKKMGINIKAIVDTNRGDLMGTVRAFGLALDSLSEFERQQALETVFGKYQYARLGALFKNIARDGSQAARAMDLAGMSVQDLAALSEKELSVVSESVTNKFLGAVERLKVAIAPIGEMFLKVATPIIEVVTKIADKFNELPDNVKTAIAAVVGVVGLIAPAVLMGVGLIGNAIGNGLKFILALRGGIKGLVGILTGSSQSFQYQAGAALDAAAAANALDGAVTGLTGDLLIQEGAVNALASAYGDMAGAARAAAASMPTGFPRPTMGGRGTAPRRFAIGGMVGGTGNKDTEPALLTPGEFVMNRQATQKFGPILNAMNAGTISGYAEGDRLSGMGSVVASHFAWASPARLAESLSSLSSTVGNLEVSLLELTQVGENEYEVRKRNVRMEELAGQNLDILAGGKSFAGTTMINSAERNAMFQATGIAGEPFTITELQDFAATAEQARSTVAEKFIPEIDNLSAEAQHWTDALSKSTDTTQTNIDYMKEQTKSGLVLAKMQTQRRGEKLTADQAELAASQKLAQIDEELARLRASGVNDTQLLQEAERMYKGALLSETKEMVAGPRGTGGGVTRDVATGRGGGSTQSARRRFSLIRVGQTALAYGGRSATKVTDAILGRAREVGNVATEGVADGARTRSPSEATRQTGEDVDQGIIDGMQAKEGEVKAQGEKVGKAAVESVQQGADAEQLSLFDQSLQPNLPQQEQLQLFDIPQGNVSAATSPELDAAMQRLTVATENEAQARERVAQAEKNTAEWSEKNTANIQALNALAQEKADLERQGLNGTQRYIDVTDELAMRYQEALGANDQLRKLNKEEVAAIENLNNAKKELTAAEKEAARLQEQNNLATKQNTDAKQKETQTTQAGAKVPPKGPPGQPPTGQPPAEGQPGKPVPVSGGAGGIDDLPKQSKTLSQRMHGFSNKLFGASAAFTGLTIAASFMGGKIGEVANTLMPLSFGLDAVTGIIGILPGPIGIAAAAFAAVGAGLYYLNNQMNSVREEARGFADALTTSAAQVTQVGKYFGNESLIQRQRTVDIASRAGIKTKDVAAGMDFIASDVGQQMAKQFSTSLEQQGGTQSVQAFANKLASMMVQGVVDIKQAKQMAAGLAQQLGQPELSAKIIGQLERIVGPNGEDLKRNPLKIAAEITTNEQQIVGGLIDPINNAINKAMTMDNGETAKSMILSSMTAGVTGLAQTITQLGIDIPYITDISKNITSFIDQDFQDAVASVQTYGKAIGNTLRNAYDNLNASIIKNQELIQNADKKDKPRLREVALREEAKIRENIAKIRQKAEEDFGKLVQQNAALSKEALDGMQVGLKEMYDDPIMQMYLDNIISRTGGLDQQVRFDILANLQGGINPSAFSSMLDLIGNDEQAGILFNIAVDTKGIDATNKFLIDNMQIEDQTIRREFLIEFTTQGDPKAAADALGYTDEKRQELLDAAEKAQQAEQDAFLAYEEGTGPLAQDLADAVNAGMSSMDWLEQYTNKANEARGAVLAFDEERSRVLNRPVKLQEGFTQQDFAMREMKGVSTADITQADVDTLQKYTLIMQDLAAMDIQPKIDMSKISNNEELQRVNKVLEDFVNLPPSIQKKIDVDALQATAAMADFDINWEKQNQRKDIFKAIGVDTSQANSAMQAFGMSWEQFNALPNISKVMTMTYLTRYVTVTEAYNSMKDVNFGTEGAEAYRTFTRLGNEQAQIEQNVSNLPGVGNTPTTTGNNSGGGGAGDGGGGGGGGGETAKTGADLVKEMLDQLRLQLKFLGDYKKVGDEVKSGLAEALRNAGAPEQLIADIISKGADGIKIAKELLKDKAKKLKELTALTLEVTRLTFVEQQRAEAANLAAQTKSQMALANAGISPDIAANLSTENAQAVAAAYQAYQAAQRKADAAEEKSKEKRKQANKELEKARKNWEQVTTAIKQNTAEQEKNAIAQAILAAKQENINNQNRIKAALVLAGKGFTATDIAGVTENQAVSNQIVSYTDKLRQLQAEKAKLEAKGKKNWSEEERKRYKVLNKDIEKTRKEYEKLILDIKILSAEQKKSLVSGTTIGFGAAAINAKNQREAITSLLGMKDKDGNPLYTFDQASSIAGNEQDAAAIISANQRVVDANKAMADYMAKGGKSGTAQWRKLQKEINQATKAQNDLNASIAVMTKEQQALNWQSIQQNINKEIAKQANTQKFINLGIKDGLILNKLNELSLEDQNYFLSLNKEQQDAFLASLEQMIPLSEKLAYAFDRIAAAQQLQSLMNEKAANEYMGTTTDQLDQQTKSLSDQLQVQNDLLKVQQNRIKVIEEQNNDYNRGLDLISRQEEAINKTFDDRLSALDKVQQANDRIAQQQQNQLNLSQALAQGDIYAATQAAQQIKQDNATAAIENTRTALEEARTNALKNLTVDVNGELLTRDEIEKRILANNDQIYQINEDQIKPIQATIDSLNDQLDAVGRLRQKWEDYYKYLEDNATDPVTGLKYKDLQKLKQWYDAIFAAQAASAKDARAALEQAMTQTGIKMDTGTFFTKFGINPNVGVQPTAPTQPGGATTQDVTTAREEAIKALPEVQKVLDTAKAIKTTFTEIPAEITKFVKSLVDNAQPAIAGLTKYIKDTFAPTVETVKDKFVRMEQAVTKINDTLPLIDKFIPTLVKTLQEKLVDIVTGISNKVDNIHTKSKDLSTFYGNAAAAAQSLATALRAAAAAAAALAAAQSGGGSQDGGKKQNPPQKKPRFSGGVIPGGIPRDSVPIMASPGEFVVRNAMVDKYGMPLLNSINQGSFDPTFRTPSSNNYGNVTRNIDTNNSSTMYNNNYSISVTANTNANADDIATATVMKIRQLNSMQIRGARG